MSKNTHIHNGVRYTLICSTRDFRDKEPKHIKEVIPQTDFGIMDMAFKKVKHGR